MNKISPTFDLPFILLQTYRKTPVNSGSPIKVNEILIENIAENGRIGKAYKPFPIKYKSKYVPNKTPSRMDKIKGEFCLTKDGNGLLGDGCELHSFECFAVFMFNLPIHIFLWIR